MKPKYFISAAQFRKWLEKNHAKTSELFVGFYKKASGKKSITYHEALDEALCFGWIDGVRKTVDETSYMQRFTPRRPRSIWSNINVGHVERLRKEGRMAEAGLKAYALRDPKRTGIYAFENKPRKLSLELEEKFSANERAWEFFQSEPPSIRRTCIYWVMSAKKEETRIRRLDNLIECSAQGIRLGVLETKKKR